MNKTARLIATLAALGALSNPAFAQDAPNEAPDDKAAPADDAKPEEAPPPDAGPSEEDLAKAREHFGTGKQLFDQGKFREAVTEFKESYRLSKNPLLLYNVGFTLDQLGEEPMALFYYKKFLSDSAPDAANRDAATERVTAIEKAAGGAGDGRGDAGGEVTSFQHAVIDEAPPRKPLDITAVIPEGSNWKVLLHFRAQGQSKFTTVEMTARYNEMVGRIPAAAMTGKSVQYYIEVTDASGTVLDSSGRSTSPNLVLIDPSAKARFYADMQDATNWQSGSGGEDGGTGGGEGGWMDVQSSKFQYLKWGSTFTAGGMMLLAGTFFVLSNDAASELETEAIDSRDECTTPPCRNFAGKQRDLQAKGQRYETLTNVSLGVGVAAGIAAGIFWYMDMKGDRSSGATARDETPTDDRFTAVPVVSDDFIGGAAALRF